MDHNTTALLEYALGVSQRRGDDLLEHGKLARELGERYHKEVVRLTHDDQADLAREQFKQAERYFHISTSCFIELGDPTETYLSMGLLGALQFDGGYAKPGIAKLREAIAVMRTQGAEKTELDLIILVMLRVRPESWVYLKRALWLTRKDSPNAYRRLEIIGAAIGNDIHEWVTGRQRAQAV